VSSDYFDPYDPLCKPLTIKQAQEVTGRTRRTLERWVQDGLLTKYERQNQRRVVILFNEAQVTEVEKRQSDAARENRDRIRRRGGRPGSRGASGEPAT